MLRALVPVIFCVALVSCGGGDGANHESSGEGTVEDATLTKLSLASDAFQDGRPIPTQYTCDGADQTPALHWGEPPPRTKGFALVVDDPDAPSGTFRHWGVYDIPASARSIGGSQKAGTEAHNDFGKSGYGGPCPPKGHGIHHYHFKLFALDIGQLGLSPGAKVLDVERAAGKHALALGELVGTYERK
jgi:Raf kinase inhibitor-like YbhB/YbcL family protein